jgi:hypothetical protein
MGERLARCIRKQRPAPAPARSRTVVMALILCEKSSAPQLQNSSNLFLSFRGGLGY